MRIPVTVIAGIVASLIADPAKSQALSGKIPDSIFARIAMQVSSAEAGRGRAVLDSLIGTTSPSSSDYPQLLFWRASLSPDANEAEADYTTIIRNHSASRWSDEAQLRLAQLAIARRFSGQAINALTALRRNTGTDRVRALSSAWLARAQFETGSVSQACEAIRESERYAPQDQAVREIVSSQLARCASFHPVKASSDSAEIPGAGGSETHVGKQPGAAPTTHEMAAGRFSVQVAAYDVRSQAEELAKKLRSRFPEVRVDGDARPYRVRIGRYTSAAEAAAVLRKMKSAGQTGFIVTTDNR